MSCSNTQYEKDKTNFEQTRSVLIFHISNMLEGKTVKLYFKDKYLESVFCKIIIMYNSHF